MLLVAYWDSRLVTTCYTTALRTADVVLEMGYAGFDSVCAFSLRFDLLFTVVSSELVLLSKLTSVLDNPSNLQQEVQKLTTARITATAASDDRKAV